MATEKEAVNWFIGKARTAAGYRTNITDKNPNRERADTVVGKLYFFWYDPKMKAVLPIYDRFPLVFPIKKMPGGFQGLNIHYLSPSERSTLLGNLSGNTNNKKFDESTRLKLTYDFLSRSPALNNLSRPCFKQYLFDHVRSPFIEVYANEWDKAAQLPVDLFVRKI